MSWKSTVVGGKYFEGYWLHSQEWDSCIHAWSNLTSRWTKSSVSRGVQNAQSVGALLPHHSAQSYGSGLALETKLCVRGYEPNAAMIHRRQHGAASGEGAADESAAGTDATAVAEHALALVPGDRSQCGKPPTCLCFSTWQPLASKKLKRFFIFTHGSYSHGYTLRAGKNCRKKALAQSLLLKVQMCSFIHDNNVNIKICITKHVCFGDTMIHVEEVSTLFYMVATSDSDNLRYVYSCHLNS